jgi:hypothetical protein
VYETVRGKEKLVAATPLWPDALDATVIASALLMLSGFVLVMVINRLAGKTPLFQGH